MASISSPAPVPGCTVGVTAAVAGKGYKADKNGDQFTVSKANQYTVTGNAKNTSLSIGSYTYGDVDKYDADKDAAYYVLIRTYEDDEIDIISFDGKAQAKPAKLFGGEDKIVYDATIEDKTYDDVDAAKAAIKVTKKVNDEDAKEVTTGITFGDAVEDTTNTDTTVKVYKIAVKVDGKDIKTLTFKVKVVAGGTVGAEIKDEVKTADTVVKADDADL
mgnify:FL=1